MTALDDLGKTPIPGDSPVGTDVRFDPDFEAISTQMEKLSSPTASGTVDWDKVGELCATILAEKSKDLLIGCYLCAALLQTRGLSGLATGVHILKELIETYWETLFPAKKRMKGRINALVWWKDRVESRLGTATPETWDADKRGRLLDDLKAINAFLGDNAEDAPLFNTLINTLAGLIAEQAQDPPAAPEPAPPAAPEPAPATPPPPTAQPPSPAAQPAAPVAVAVAVASGPDGYRSGLDLLARASDALVAADRFHPLAYRLNRIAAWTDVEALPPAQADKTMLEPPDALIRASLDDLYRAGNFQDLLEAAESRVREFLFWIDLSRLAAEALERLGQPRTADDVTFATWSFSRRLAGLERLCFADGTPFADAQTRAWLKTATARYAGVSAAQTPAAGADQAIDKAVAQAQSLMQDNQLGAALALLRDGLRRAASARERLGWQLALCRFLDDAGQSRIAAPYRTEMLAVLERHRIEQWEPELAAEALEVVLAGGDDTGDEHAQQRMAELKDRIALLDPARALGL